MQAAGGEATSAAFPSPGSWERSWVMIQDQHPCTIFASLLEYSLGTSHIETDEILIFVGKLCYPWDPFSTGIKQAHHQTDDVDVMWGIRPFVNGDSFLE